MPSHHIRQLFLTLLFLAGTSLLLLTSWPLPTNRYEWEVKSPVDTGADFAFALDWPAWMRPGEAGTAILTVKASNKDQSGRIAPVIIETRLEFAGVKIEPGSIISQPLGSTTSLQFRWRITALAPASQAGTLWIYAIVDTPGREPETVALAARSLEVHATGLRGIPYPIFRMVGVLLILIPFILFVIPIRQSRSLGNEAG